MRTGSIITRVLFAVLLSSAAFAVALAYNATTQQRLIAELVRLNDGWVPIMRELDAIQGDVQTFARVASNPEPVVLQPALRASLSLFPVPDRVVERCDALEAQLVEMLSEPLGESERAFASNVRLVVVEIADAVAEAGDEAALLLRDLEGEPPTLEPRRSDVVERLSAVDKRVGDLRSLVERRIDDAVSGVAASERESVARIGAASAAAVLLAMLVALIIRRSLQPIRELTALARRIERGDYRPAEVAGGNDEIGQLAREFAGMADAIRERDGRLRNQNIALEEAYGALLDAQRAQVRAERLAAIGEVSSRITHELRNPLSSLGLNVEMLADELPEGGSADEARALLAAIEGELQRLTKLTDRYLGMAKGDGRAREPVDLGVLLRAVATQVEAECAHEGVSLVFEAERDLTVIADPDQLRQVALNLLRNALAAVREQDDAATIALLATRGAGGDVELRVEDDGPGVATDLDGDIFEPFVSGHADGTGLGLSISRRIVVDHGGSITAERSARFGGACFVASFEAASERLGASWSGPEDA